MIIEKNIEAKRNREVSIFTTLKKIGGYALIALVVVLSFLAGRVTSDYPSSEVVSVEAENQYAHAYDEKEVSVAINENRGILIIDKKTGKYVLYSESIGMMIFKMYASNIYNEQKK